MDVSMTFLLTFGKVLPCNRVSSSSTGLHWLQLGCADLPAGVLFPLCTRIFLTGLLLLQEFVFGLFLLKSKTFIHLSLCTLHQELIRQDLMHMYIARSVALHMV